MKKRILVLALLAIPLLLSACAPQTQPLPTPAATIVAESPEPSEAPQPEETAAPAKAAEYHKITAQEAKARMDSGDPVLILDVRTPSEYAAGHIPGAVLLPLDTIGEDTREVLSDPDAELLVYCRSGSRSRTASMQLVDLGYTGVYDFGGIIDWPYDTVKD